MQGEIDAASGYKILKGFPWSGPLVYGSANLFIRELDFARGFVCILEKLLMTEV